MYRQFRIPLAALFLVACGGSPADVAPPPQPSAAPPEVSAAPTAAPTPTVSASASASAAPAEKHPPHWTYSGEEGPEKWGDLTQDFGLCKVGVNQTPIDLLPKKVEKDKSLKALEFGLKPIPLKVLNNGHTVQVVATDTATLNAAGDTWSLAQFHFHAPSEHTVDGKHFDMELHFVHKNAKGALAVVGVLLKKGKANKALASVFDAAPAEVSKDPKSVEGVMVDVSSLLPAKAPYSTYPGSLTTPPCSEGVTWFVLDKVAEVSEAQIAKFREVTHGDTARPVQPLGARKVTAFK